MTYEYSEPFQPYVIGDTKPSEVFEKNRETIRRLAARHNTANPRVFGSVLKGRDMVGSDLDILVDRVEDTETTSGTSMFDIFNLEEALEDALGIEVNVTTPNGIKEYFKDEIVGMAEPV